MPNRQTAPQHATTSDVAPQIAPQIHRLPICEGRGIYALLLAEEVVYIGRSTCNVFARLGRHMRDKKFDAVLWHPVAEDENLDAIEREMIRELRPVYNSQHK